MRRGYATFAAILAVLAVAVLLSVGLAARRRDLGFEARTICRVRAKWAAESAIARGRAKLARGAMPYRSSGQLGERTGYQLIARSAPGGVEMEGLGRCTVETSTHTVEVRIFAKTSRSGRVQEWQEGPTER